jgi:hypothetical protein
VRHKGQSLIHVSCFSEQDIEKKVNMASNNDSWGNRLRENLEYATSLAAALKEEQSSPDCIDSEKKDKEIARGDNMAHPSQKIENIDSKQPVVPTSPADDADNNDKSMFHSLFSDAAETWIQGQTSNSSDIPEARQNSSYEDSSHDYEADEEIDSDSYDVATKSDVEDDGVSLDEDNGAIGSTLSTASTRERRNNLASQKSFDTNTSLGTSTHGSFDSTESVEIEMDAELHGSWTTVGAESHNSSSFSSLGDATKVYIRDKQFCWLPATVLEYRKDCAIVAVDLPETWEKSTYTKDQQKILSNDSGDIHTSMKKMERSDLDALVSEHNMPANRLRIVKYKDYEQGDLPKQNLQGNGKRNMEDLFHQHPPAIFYNLKERHYLQKPYTRVGDILIAMNPFMWIDELYLPKTRDLYSRHLIWNGRLAA